jgi:hypothetical protein
VVQTYNPSIQEVEAGVRGVVQVVEHLLNKRKALNSNPSTTKTPHKNLKQNKKLL